MPNSTQIKKAIKSISDVARQFGISGTYLVGGFPRTIVMGKPLSEVHDLDIATESPEKATQLAGLVASAQDASNVETLHRTMTVTMSVGGVDVDFQGPSSHEDVREYLRVQGIDPTPLALNIYDRDFTINSLAMPLDSNEIMDVTGRGIQDIKRGMISSILPAGYSVPNNPLMITRAVRFSARFGFGIEASLWKAMKTYRASIKTLSPERLAIEAYVLSKHHGTRRLLRLLGLQDLLDDEVVSMGEEATNG